MDKMELIIKVLNGETKTVCVNPNTTIGELKQQIAPLFQATPSQLKLSITNGQTSQLDHDQSTVRDYGLQSGSNVMLLISNPSVPFQVFVKNHRGQMKTYDISDDETVDQLMRKSYQKEGVPEDQHRLIYKDRQLKSGTKLQDYNIAPGSTIHFVLRLRGG